MIMTLKGMLVEFYHWIMKIACEILILNIKEISVGFYHWIVNIACGILICFSESSEKLIYLEVNSSRCEGKLTSLPSWIYPSMIAGSNSVIEASKWI
jgi:hypothetical protein